MGSPEPRELRSVGEPDDETMAAKKRSRRVSFAETTAVHVFDRDEDFETPSSSDEGPKARWPRGDPPGDAPSDSDDSKGSVREDDDDDEVAQEPFLRDMESSSPGSTVGSVTSNDDDNFFGPVSASFIRSGRLSESGMSDDNNHDITLDSTAFSLHFRNIVPPDDRTSNSAGSIHTPTGEKLPDGPEGLEQHTGSTASKSNNSMSLIVENPRRYDYGNISPTLEALLAEVDRSMQPTSQMGTYDLLTSKVRDVNVSSKDDMHVAHIVVPNDKVEDGNADPSCDMQTTSVVNPSSSEKTKATGHPLLTEHCKNDTTAANAQCSDLLSPSYQKRQNSFILESDNAHENSIQCQANVSKHYANSSPGSVPSASHVVILDGQQLVESESVYTPNIDVQPFQSPLQGSISSLRAKRQQLFLPQSNLTESPAREDPLSSLEIKLTRHSQKLSAIKYHISKFRIPETPTFSDSRPAMLGNDHPITAHKICLDENIDDHNTNHIDASVDSNGENLLHGCQKARGHETIVELNGFGTSNNISPNKKNEVVGGTVKSTDAISCSSSFISETNLKQNLLTSHDSIGQVTTPNMYGSSQRQNAVELKENHLVLDISSMNISSNVQIHGYNLTASQEGHCAPGAGEAIQSSSLFEKNRLQVSAQFSTPIYNDFRSLKSLEQLAHSDDNIVESNSQEVIESCVKMWSHDMDIGIDENLIKEGETLPDRETFTSPYEHTAVDTHKKDTPMKSKFFAGTVQRTGKEVGSVIDNNTMHSNLVKSMAPLSTQDPRLHNYDGDSQYLLSAQESVSAQNTDMGVKRKIEEIQHTGRYFVNELIRAYKSPKLMHKTVVNKPKSSLQHHTECISEAIDTGGQTSRKHWTDIVVKVSEATKQPLSSSVCNLTLQEIDILEDILDKLQLSRKYERFCTSLRNDEHLGDRKQQRIAEARFLQDKLLFEQVKLQLKRVKLNLLCSKAKLSQSGVQECRNLKSKFSQLRILGTRSVQTREGCAHFDSTNSSGTIQEEQRNKLLSKRQELELLDQKVKCLAKYLETSFGIKGNLDFTGILKVVNEHLEMRKHCRIVQQDLQLWELSDIVKTNDQSQIVLNYRSFLLLRFTIDTSQGSSIVVVNLLNDIYIEKSFPKMNAGMAFAFVFKAKGARRLATSKCFQQETLLTSLLLGTLLDVIGEVQASRRELLNLLYSSFHSQCSSQLELHFCFLNFKKGWKVTLSLDVTELSCAVYPSKQSELQFRIISGAQTTMPTSVLDEITGAVQSLQDGQLMILRLCRYISKVVQALI